MAGTTSNNSWPYPESSDFVADGATAIENLADAIDADFDTGVLKVDSTNSRVGINDATPSYALDVTGDINATGDLRIGGNAIGTWQTWTPAVNQGGTTFGVNVAYAVYTQVNKLVVCQVRLSLTSGTGASGSPLVSSIPVTNGAPITSTAGTALVYDGNLADVYSCTVYGTGGTSILFQPTSTIAWNGIGASSAPVTFTTGDTLTFTAIYEAA